ncbi:MAG: phosphomethylpyrimidine synthase ThiC [Candidatus Hecatellaceae archaeon]|nr:MAG: phosphomethylpyrimidine synthase [Candidatus Hecatellales archaeon]
MTLMDAARRGEILEEFSQVAEAEKVNVEKIMAGLRSGRIIIVRNVVRTGEIKPLGIGEGLRVKVNANVGSSPEVEDLEYEVEKAKTAVKYGADTVMDLSTGGDLDHIRRRILEEVKVPVGTVPIYQAGIEAVRKGKLLVDMTEDDMLKVIERHAKDGVDFMTIHAGITMEIVERLQTVGRVAGIVSRGGAFLASWILRHNRENPLYTNFDRILEIAREYDFAISLGDALRPGSIADSSDWFQLQELLTIKKLISLCWDAGVQVMVEGPGHVPLDEVEANVRIQKALCRGAPFYVLGPLVTDIAAGYDHIAGAIGGALAAIAGADFLCYVTPSEHLALPSIEDVKEGVVAARIAAHAADIVRLGEKARSLDLEISKARARLDWEAQHRLSVDPEKARRIRLKAEPKAGTCSMCGEYCVYKVLKRK